MKNILLLIIAIGLTACATPELKAPCDYVGHWCGKKIAINS